MTHKATNMRDLIVETARTAANVPTGRSAAEARRIVEADLGRLDELAEVWGELTEAEQRHLIDTARALVAVKR